MCPGDEISISFASSGVKQLLEQASEQRTKEAAGEEPLLVDLISADNDAKGLPKYVGSHATAYYYDKNRGATPTYVGKVCAAPFSPGSFPSLHDGVMWRELYASYTCTG